MQITSTQTPHPVQPGQKFEHQMTCDGVGPFAWSLNIGPPGMSIIAPTGLVEWTPDVAGLHQCHVSVMDSLGNQASQSMFVSVVGVTLSY